VHEIAQPLGIGFLGPRHDAEMDARRYSRMPKGRYRIMTNYMPKVGKYGIDMMYRTCTVQTISPLRVGSRHGEKAACVAGRSAGCHRPFRQFAVTEGSRTDISRFARKSGATRQQRAGMLLSHLKMLWL